MKNSFKKIVWLVGTILFVFFFIILYLTGLITAWLPYSLPWQQCGGSTLKSKPCISGFKCKPTAIPNIPGAGGTCLPI